jgi:predicted MPP superfamily phosphohydrolase
MPVLLALLAIAALALAWATLVERHWYAVRRESVRVLPTGSKPILVLHIGDLHLAHWQQRKIRFIENLSKYQPDLVVNTGDNLGAKNSEAAALKALASLGNVPGVFVNGSNDYFEPRVRNPFTYLKSPSDAQHGKPLNTKKLVSGFEKWGWLNLNNAGGQLTVNGNKIAFAGVDDAHDNLDDLVFAKAVLGDAAGFRIGVSHAPYLRVIDAFASLNCGVMFSGHTHGGQVCLPWFGALVTNCDLPKKYAKGLSRWGKNSMVLNVVAGIGHSIYAPVRFFCRPEVRLLTLLAK